MRVAVLTHFKADKKEPLALMIERVYQVFLQAGLEAPQTSFSFADSPAPGTHSYVDRALQKHPEFEPFHFAQPMLPNNPPVGQITNAQGSPAFGTQLTFETLLELVRRVPRPFAFNHVSVHFHSPAFGEPLPAMAVLPVQAPGVIISDSWWINGRNRSLAALTVIDADPATKNLPPYPEPVAQVIAACGKVVKATQLPLPGFATAPNPVAAAQGDPEVTRRVTELMRDYRSRLVEILDRAALPHGLPSAMEALHTGATQVSGPKKPPLVAAFKPLGYSCRGEKGAFTLTRRTPSNLTIELSLDVGTWSNSLTAFMLVHGVGFTARLRLPPTKNALEGGQYKIGDAARWQQIVDNLRALVVELDRTFVPDIEKASGPTPEWFTPESR
jgi:hypothetical protein